MLRLKLFTASLALFSLLPAFISSQTVEAYQTTPDLLESLTHLQKMRFRSNHFRHAAPPLITVDDSQHFQTIDGFGASLTDAAAWLFATKLSPKLTDSTFDKLFSRRHGIALSFLRQPIGSSDLAVTFYSYDDLCKQTTTACTTPPGLSDPDLKHFSLAHDQEYILPLLKKALAMNPDIRIMLSPWSPPGWMKTSGSMLGLDPVTKEPSTLRPEFFAAYADYLVKTIEGYQTAGIPVYALSVQNEPLYAAPTYSGMLMPAAQQATFLADDLAPAMAAAHLTTEVMVYDHNWNHPEYPRTVFENPKAYELAAGTSWHHYAGNPDVMTQLHNDFPQKGEWVTEASGGTWQKDNVVVQEAGELIAVMRNWSKSYVLWALATDQNHGPHVGGCSECRGVVTINLVDPENPRVIYEPDYYVLGQASKFVFPGAVRIASNEPAGTDLKDVAFQNADGTIVLYTLNAGTKSQLFRVGFHGKTIATVLPAGSVATFLWKP